MKCWNKELSPVNQIQLVLIGFNEEKQKLLFLHSFLARESCFYGAFIWCVSKQTTHGSRALIGFTLEAGDTGARASCTDSWNRRWSDLLLSTTRRCSLLTQTDSNRLKSSKRSSKSLHLESSTKLMTSAGVFSCRPPFVYSRLLPRSCTTFSPIVCSLYI